MATGKVKFFNQEKGFGFISPTYGGKGVFFHFTNIKDNNKKIHEGEVVEYEETLTDKGPAAINIRRV